MARQLKKITARKKLCFDNDADIFINRSPIREALKENKNGDNQCSNTIKVKSDASTHKNKPKGYKLRGPSNVKYFEEEHDTEDFSPDCSEYIPSPDRILPDSRNTSSLGESDDNNITESHLLRITSRQREIESRSTSSLGRDSQLIENILDNENISRPPSTVSNLSIILSEIDFVATPNIIYKNNNFQSPRQAKKKPSIDKFGFIDISLKPPNPTQSVILNRKPNNNNLESLDPNKTLTPNKKFTLNKTLTPNNPSQDTTLARSVLSQAQQIPEEDIKKEIKTYEIQIIIEPESPESVSLLKIEQNNDEASKQNNEEESIEKSKNESTNSLHQNVVVEVNQENPIEDEINLMDNEEHNIGQGNETTLNLNPSDLTNQSSYRCSASSEPKKQNILERPIQIISIEVSDANDIVEKISENQELDNVSITNDTDQVANAQPTQVTDSESELEDQTKKLTRKRKRDPKEWKDNKNKRLKNSGKEYEGTRNKKLHPSKTILPSCNCKKSCGLKFNNELRQSLHSRFYELANREYQWQYITRHVKSEHVKKITVIRKNNRTQTLKYYFPLNHEEVQVCKIFFLNTLSITEQMIYTALEKIKADESLIDKRGLHLNRPHRMKPTTEASIKTHIKLFPKVKSHYIRKDSKRQYLDESLNISKMYRLYKIWFAEQNYSDEDNLPIATKRQYERIFNTEFNLSFFQPKKDQCTLCSQYQQADSAEKASMEESYNRHIRMKDRVRELKNEEKKTLKKEDTVLAIFDLQKVISMPRSEVSIFHYKRKYPIYNFTIFEALEKKGFCYVWHAEIGKKGCIEIGSCLVQFIHAMYQKGIRKFIFYSDGCYGQNKNRYIFALFLYLSITMKIDITHRFFVGGHSQNEGDSMHACIERALKNKVVYTPDQIYNIIMNAKVSGQKYSLKEMQQSEILDIKELVEPRRWLQDKNGVKVRWSDVMEISVSHTKPNSLLYKYDYDEEYHELDFELPTTSRGIQGRRRGNKHEVSKTIDSVELKPAYSNLLPITKALYDDLQSLCNCQAIPRHYHAFYNNLTHSTSAEDDYNED